MFIFLCLASWPRSPLKILHQLPAKWKCGQCSSAFLALRWAACYNKQSILSSIMKVLYLWQHLRLLHTNKQIKYSGAGYNKQSIIFIIIPTWYTSRYHRCNYLLIYWIIWDLNTIQSALNINICIPNIVHSELHIVSYPLTWTYGMIKCGLCVVCGVLWCGVVFHGMVYMCHNV